MNLIVSRSKNSATYYVQKSFRSDAGKTTAKIIERLGSIEELIARFGQDDPVGSARKYVADLTNNLHGSAGFRTDTQIVSKQTMKKTIQSTKTGKQL